MRRLVTAMLLTASLVGRGQGDWHTYSHSEPEFTIAYPVGWEAKQKEEGSELRIGDLRLEWQAEVSFEVTVQEDVLRVSVASYGNGAARNASEVYRLLKAGANGEAGAEVSVTPRRVGRVACVRVEENRAERAIVRTYMPAKGAMYVISLDVAPKWLGQCTAGYEYMLGSVVSESLRAAEASRAARLRELGLNWPQIKEYTGHITADGEGFVNQGGFAHRLETGETVMVTGNGGYAHHFLPAGYWPELGLWLAKDEDSEEGTLSNIAHSAAVVSVGHIASLSGRPLHDALTFEGMSPDGRSQAFTTASLHLNAHFCIISEDLRVKLLAGYAWAYVSRKAGVLVANEVAAATAIWLDGGEDGRRVVLQEKGITSHFAVSPDGSLLAIETHRGLELVDLDDLSRKVIASHDYKRAVHAAWFDPIWSCDSSYLYALARIFTREGEVAGQLPVDQTHRGHMSSYNCREMRSGAKWSPTRNTFARMHIEAVREDRLGARAQYHRSLSVWDEEKGVLQVSLPEGVTGGPHLKWSPDGDFISLRYAGNRPDIAVGPRGVMLIRRDLSEAVICSYSYETGGTYKIERFGWTPDGEWLMVDGTSEAERADGIRPRGIVRFRPEGTEALMLAGVPVGRDRDKRYRDVFIAFPPPTLTTVSLKAKEYVPPGE